MATFSAIYAHAIRFAVDQHGTRKFHAIVKYKRYKISRASAEWSASQS